MNYYRSFVIILLSTSLFVNCKVTDKKIIGNYIDRKKGDTLRLFSNKTFEYQEKLSFGESGWNTGNWAIDDEKISFFNVKPDPVVGYLLKKDISGDIIEPLKITLILNASKKPVAIKSVLVSLNKNFIDTSNFKVNLNSLTVNTTSFDSISMATFYFPTFSFAKKEFEKNKHYEIAIYPAERLFELDKYTFNYKKNSLFNNIAKTKFRKI